jgi:hypothetical protein
MCQTMERACNAKDQQLRNLADHLHSAAAAHAHDAIACMDCPPPSHPSPCGHSPPPPRASFFASSSSSSPLSILPAPMSAALSQLHHSSCLRYDLSLGSPLCFVVKLMPSGVLVSASVRFCQQSGYREQQLVGTAMTPELRPGTCPLLIQKGDEKAGLPERVVQQYGRSRQHLSALLKGDVERVDQTWRCVMADGQQYEVPACWSEPQRTQRAVSPRLSPSLTVLYLAVLLCCSWMEPSSDEEGKVRRLITVWSLQDAVQVDAPPPPQSCSSECRAACEWTAQSQAQSEAASETLR